MSFSLAFDDANVNASVGESLKIYELVGEEQSGSISTYVMHLVFFGYVNSMDPINDRSKDILDIIKSRRATLRYKADDALSKAKGEENVVYGYVESVEEIYRSYQGEATHLPAGQRYSSRMTWRLIFRPLWGLLATKTNTRAFKGMSTFDILLQILGSIETNLALDKTSTDAILKTPQPYLDISSDGVSLNNDAVATLEIVKGSKVSDENDLFKTPIIFAFQNDETDYVFLKRLLDRVGYYFVSSGNFGSGGQTSEILKAIRSDVRSSDLENSVASGPNAIEHMMDGSSSSGVFTRNSPLKQYNDIAQIYVSVYHPSKGENGETIGTVSVDTNLNMYGTKHSMVTDYTVAGFDLSKNPIKNADDLRERYLVNRVTLEAARFGSLSRNYYLWTRQYTLSLMSTVDVHGKDGTPKSHIVVSKTFQFFDTGMESSSAGGVTGFLGSGNNATRLAKSIYYPELRSLSAFSSIHNLFPADEEYFPQKTDPTPIQSAPTAFVFSRGGSDDSDWETKAQPNEYGEYGVILSGIPTFYEKGIPPFEPSSLSFADPEDPSHIVNIPEQIPTWMRVSGDFSGNSTSPIAGMAVPLYNGSQVTIGFIQGDTTLPYIGQFVGNNFYDQTPSRLDKALQDLVDFYRFN